MQMERPVNLCLFSDFAISRSRCRQEVLTPNHAGPVNSVISPTKFPSRSLSIMSLALTFAAAPIFAQQSSTTAQTPTTQPAAMKAIAAPTPLIAPTPAPTHKMGPLQININWRERTEDWNWFKGNTGNSDYTFWDSLLRIGIGQTGQHFDWYIDGEQPTILGLPTTAVVAAPQGQLGLGGSYYAANNNHIDVANGFLKYAYVNIHPTNQFAARIGRFEYFDGLEMKAKDPLLQKIIQSRISSRLISNFAFTAVQRTYDGVQLSLNSGANNVTLFGARPTQGVFQVKGEDELDVDNYYGAYTHSGGSATYPNQFRVFADGYIDHRTLVLKTDNRSTPAKTADKNKIEIATWGGNFEQVINTPAAGKFYLLGWGVLQTGSWGSLSQLSTAAVGEAGWQLPVPSIKPGISAGYSYGSGDGNATDTRHGTFFQILTTPRQYARFPFYNMMNNEDAYLTVSAQPLKQLSLSSEAHTLRLASAADLWYSGGGAFQPTTFGYQGRPSNGNRPFANVWDINADYRFCSNFSATFYYGHAWGKTVIATIYPKDADGQLLFVESNFHF
jgi:hypothetical protein